MKSVPPATPFGSNITYTIQVTNSGGPSDAQNVTITDVLPAGTTFVSLVQTGGPPFACTTGATVTCTIGTLQPLATATFTLQVAPPPSAPVGTVVTNTATISSTTPPLFPTPTSSTASTTISGADLVVTKTAPSTVAAGATFTYTVNVTNNGPLDAFNTTFTDVLPSGVTFDSLLEVSPPLQFFNQCSTPPKGSGGTITCTGDSFVGFPATFFITVTASPTLATGATIVNTATATTTSVIDINPDNNKSTATTTVNPGNADLAITKSAPTNPVITSAPVTFTLNVTNNGPSTATNVVVTDTLPTGVTFTSATPSQGSCSGTTTVVCSLGTLASGASATITIQAQAGPPGNNTANTATVTSANPDSNPANNTATTAAFTIANFNNIPAASPLGLMLLAMILAVGGAFILRR